MKRHAMSWITKPKKAPKRCLHALAGFLSVTALTVGIVYAQSPLSPWTVINVDPENAPDGYLEAESGQHPFWVDAFNRYGSSDFCYGYRSSDNPLADPYDAAFSTLLEDAFTQTEEYFSESGFDGLADLKSLPVGGGDQSPVNPIFCKAGNLSPTYGTDHRVINTVRLSRLAHVYEITETFENPDLDRSWQFAAGEALAAKLIGVPVFVQPDTPNAIERSLRQKTPFSSSIKWAFQHGIIPALAIRAVEDKYGEEFGDFGDLQERYPFQYMRTDLPIHENQRGDGQDLDAMTSAFWWFVAEYYLDQDAQLLDAAIALADSENSYEALDTFLDSVDGPVSKGLEHVYPQFVAHYLGWPRTRFKGAITGADWRDRVIGGCQRITVSEVDPSAKIELEIAPYASVCVEAEHKRVARSWDGQATMAVTAADDIADSVFIAISYGKRTLAATPDDAPKYSCARDFDPIADVTRCMDIPTSGRDTKRDPENGRLYRFHHTDAPDLAGGVTSNLRRFVITYIPEEHVPNAEWDTLEPAKVEMTMSADVALYSGDFFDYDSLNTSYGLKSEDSPVGPPPDRQITGVTELFPSDASQSIFEGDGVTLDPGLFQSAISQSTNMIFVNDEAGNGVSFMLPEPNMPGSDVPSTIEVFPVFGKEGKMIIPDPDKTHTLEVLESSFDTFHFTADASLCMMDMEELIQMGMQGRQPDICRDGERETIEAEFAIPHPTTRAPELALEPVRTQRYLDLRAIRLARIEQRMTGRNVLGRKAEPSGGSDTAGDNSDAGNSDQSGSESRSVGVADRLECKILKADRSCDCRCEAKACAADKKLRGVLTPAENSCRLTCGKRWKSCPVATP